MAESTRSSNGDTTVFLDRATFSPNAMSLEILFIVPGSQYMRSANGLSGTLPICRA